MLNASYNFTANVEIPEGGAEGMLITQGGRFAGYGFYLLKGKPVFTWNLVDLKRVRWEGPELTPGKHLIEFEFKYDGLGAATMVFGNYSGIGQGGTGTLKVDGNVVATTRTGRDGRYQFDHMDLGSYTVKIVLPRGTYQTTDTEELEITRGIAIRGVDYGLNLKPRMGSTA